MAVGFGQTGARDEPTDVVVEEPIFARFETLDYRVTGRLVMLGPMLGG